MADYRERMVTLAREYQWASGALIGLGSGVLLQRLLEALPALRVVGVDHFVRADRKRRIQRTISARFSDRCVIIEEKSVAAASRVKDSVLDFVWLDAGHKFGCVRADLRAWWPKLRSGGWFGGHDFSDEYPGVVSAVTERFGPTLVVEPEHALWSAIRI